MNKIKITVECPACKQISETTFDKAFDIQCKGYLSDEEGYSGYVDSVLFVCSGCKVKSEIEW